MSKTQEDNATSTSEETTEEQRKKQHEEFLDSLEKSRAEFEKKSEEEIKKLSILELAQYFSDDYLLIEYYQEYMRTYYDSSNNSEELKHNAYIYLQEHSKPDIDKFIALFDTLKTKVLQLSQYEQNSSCNPFAIWTGPIMQSMNELQNLNPENLKNMTDEMQAVIAGFKQLLDSSSLQESLTAREMIIKNKDGKDDVASFTEGEKDAIAVNDEGLELELTLLQIDNKIDRLKEEAKKLEQSLPGKDVYQVPTTGSSNFDNDNDLA